MAGALSLCAIGTWRALAVEPYGLRTGAPWWGSSLGVLGLASWWMDRGVSKSRRVAWTRGDGLAWLSIAVVAVIYRVWRFADYPPAGMLGFEEFQTGGLAYDVLRDWWAVPIEFPLTNLLPAVSFRIFGLSVNALRFPFLVSSSLAPLFLYAALRRVIAPPAAWGAALLLAANRWAACAARFADEIFFAIVVVAAAAWLFVRALQEEDHVSVWAFALVSGDLFYAYTGYRVMPVIALAGAVGFAWGRRATLPAGTFGRFVLLAAVWAVILSPGAVIGEMSGTPLFFEALQRHSEAWGNTYRLAERLTTGVHRLASGWGVFVWAGDEVGMINAANAPMLDPISATLASLALLAACLRWHDGGRRLALGLLLVPLVAAALIPVNFNASRCFVVLVPLYCLIGYLFDDWLRVSAARRAWGVGSLGAIVLVAAGLNLRILQRLIDDPTVREAFLYPENTVLAAVHAAPAGSEVVLLTMDGANAFEPSDYQWFTAHQHGERAKSLADALEMEPHVAGGVYWIAQGLPEARLLPKVVDLVCPRARAEVLYADRPAATVGAVRVDDRSACHPVSPERGLLATYRISDAHGDTAETRRIDPALCAYTIPWRLAGELQDGAILNLQIRWEGLVSAPVPGAYQFRLEVLGAGAVLRIGDAVQKVTAPREGWASGMLSAEMGTEPVPLAVALEGRPNTTPRLRLSWTLPDGSDEIIPPSQLSPTA
jgi:hypothetical protein